MGILIQNSLSIKLLQTEQNDQKGCLPMMEFRTQGPIPSGSEIVANVNKEDGTAICEFRSDLREAGEDEYIDVRLYPESKTIITEAGVYSFRLRVVSELEGVDDLLYEGKIRVKTYDGGRSGQQFALDLDWSLPCAHIWLDVYSDNDAPPLFASFWLKGNIDTYEVAAYLFYKGKKIMSSENRDQAYVSNMRSVDSTDENYQYKYFTTDFHITKGYLNAEYGNMDGWHNLSLNPGDYEIKITAAKKLVRIIPFKVGEDGKIIAPGIIEQNGHNNFLMQVTAEIKSGVEPVADPSLYPAEIYFGGGNNHTGASINNVYEFFPGLTSEEGDDDSSVKLDEDTEITLNKLVENSRNNYRWYYNDLKAGGKNLESAQIEYMMYTLQGMLPSFTELLTKVPEDYMIEFADEHISLNKIHEYVKEMIEIASGIVNQQQSAANEKMAPYESVLKNDKLRICLDRPPHDYLYYTSKKKVIETPEQLASAKAWYFEGGYQEGDLLKVTMWSVKGFKFDDEGNLLEEYENSGVGKNAPSSAFP